MRVSAPTLAAVLWDLDGTLIDSEPLWIEAELAMLDRFGIEMSDATHDRLIGAGLWDAAEHFRELGVRMSADAIVHEWVEHVSDGLSRGEPSWRPGARELLGSLQDAGVPCALVTMSVRLLAEQIAAILPPGSFQAIVAGDELVDRPKPFPDAYLRGAAALDVDIAASLALEDSPTGLTSAHAAGAVAIGIPNLLPLDTAPAHELWATLAGVDAEHVTARFRALR